MKTTLFFHNSALSCSEPDIKWSLAKPATFLQQSRMEIWREVVKHVEAAELELGEEQIVASAVGGRSSECPLSLGCG